MAYEADKVVVELIAKVDQFDKPVQGSAANFDASMDKISRSATKAEQDVVKSSRNRAREIENEGSKVVQFSKLLAGQLNDIGGLLNSPRSPFVVPAREAPKVSNALKLVEVGASAMGGVLGGIAVQGAFALVEALIDLTLKSDDANAKIKEMVEGLKDQADKTRLSAQAHDIFTKSLEGVRQAADDAEKAIQALKNTQKSQEQQTVESIQASLDNATALRAETEALLNAAEAANERFRTSLASTDPRFASQFQVSADRIDALREKLAGASSAAARLENSLVEALSLRTTAESRKSEEDKINKDFDKRIEAARSTVTFAAQALRITGDQAGAEKLVTVELRKQTDELNRQRKLEIDRLKTRSPSSSGFSGRQVTSAEAAAIARSAGLQVNSADRTYGQQKALYDAWVAAGKPKDNPVARPGTSAHEGAKGRWALDIQLQPGLTAAKVKKVFGDQGVSVNVFPERGHLHVSGSRSQAAAADNAAARAAEEAARAAKNEANREQAFQNEKASLEGQVLDARQALITSVEEIATLEKQSIDIASAKYADEVANAVTVGRLHQDEADQLVKLNDERAKLLKEAVDRRLAQQRARIKEADARRAAEVAGADLQAQQELLQSQEQVAKTTKERHDIEQRIIDLQFKEERLRLENQIALAQQVQANKDNAYSLEQIKDAIAAEAEARSQLSTLPERQSNAQTGNDRQNASPLQSYFGDIQAEADDIDSAFERIAAGGLANFTDRLTDAIVNFRSLGDVGKAALLGITSDLVKLAIRLVLNATIGRLVAKVATASTAAQMAAVAAAAAPAAAAVSLATFGANAPAAIAGMAAANAAALGFATAGAAAGGLGAAFAEGGRIGGPGTSTSDSVPIRASVDEFMIKAKSARRIGYPALDYINRTGELPRYATDADYRRISPANAVATRPGAGGRGGFTDRDIATLRGIIGDAVNAMPDVQNFIGFDPDELVSRALGSPATVTKLIEILGQNKTRAAAALQ